MSEGYDIMSVSEAGGSEGDICRAANDGYEAKLHDIISAETNTSTECAQGNQASAKQALDLPDKINLATGGISG